MPNKNPQHQKSPKSANSSQSQRTAASAIKRAASTTKPTPAETIVKQRISRSTIIKLIILTLLVIAVIGYFAWDLIFSGPLVTLLSDPDRIITTVESWGLFAPLLYILLQITQTVVAPIPGQIVGSVGGILFGWWGILWTTIGTFIGCYIVFRLARRFGRPLLEKIFKKSAIDKFDFIINAKSASLILFAIFLLPGFPDDIVCYIAGLTKLSIRRLMVLVIIGRLPVIVVTNLIGDNLTTNLPLVIILCVVAVLIFGIFAWQRERIIKFLKNLS